MTSEPRTRLVRNKSSSSSLSLMNDSRDVLGEVARIDCSTWGNKGPTKFGRLSQLLGLSALFVVLLSLSARYFWYCLCQIAGVKYPNT